MERLVYIISLNAQHSLLGGSGFQFFLQSQGILLDRRAAVTVTSNPAAHLIFEVKASL